MLERLGRKLEITFFQNRFKSAKMRFHQVGVSRLQISSTN